MEIDHHDNPGLNGDTEQGDVANPYGHAEVVAHHPLEQQAPGHGVKGGKNQHKRFGHRMKNQIKQEEDDREGDRQYDLEPLPGSKLKLIFAGPVECVARLHLQLVMEQFIRLVNETAIILGVEINVDVPGELALFVPDHSRSTRERNLRYLLDRYLRARGCSQENSLQRFHIIAEITLIANVHGIALPPLDVFCHIHTADAGGNGFLNVSHGEAITSSFRTIYFHIEVEPL